MTVFAAGIMFLGPNRTALFLKRSAAGDAAGMWAFPGGKTEDGETAEQTAIRETMKETGRTVAPNTLAYHTRSIAPRAPMPVVSAEVVLPTQPVTADTASETVTPLLETASEAVDFTTFVARVDNPFIPELDAEHTGFCWASLDAPPEPLHPGCRLAIDRLTMNELGVARAMAADQLTSPQVYENVTLFAMRITGTGLSYRLALDEYVWRDPAIYLNEEFVARCNGLQVIMDHPKGATLNSEEFGDRTIGSIMLPYIKGDEVWGIAKIYDEAAIRMMTADADHPEAIRSTSPTVVFRASDNTTVTTEDGKNILIEGKPQLLDHVAVCAKGVWDKGGEAQGIAIADAQPEDQPKRAALDADKLRRLDHAVTLLNARASNYAAGRRAA